jgi:hypothetical protein
MVRHRHLSTSVYRTLTCLAACLAALFIARPAAAQTQAVYRYQGNAFTLFSCGLTSNGLGTVLCSTPGPNSNTSYKTGDRVTASMAFDVPLPPNMPLQNVRTFAGFQLALSDGHQTVTTPITSGQAVVAEVATDAFGDIIQWNVFINTGGALNGGVSTQHFQSPTSPTCCHGDGGTLKGTPPGDLARNTNSPGQWSKVDAPVGTGGRNMLRSTPDIDFDGIRGGEGARRTLAWFIDTNGAGTTMTLGEIVPGGLKVGAHASTCWSILGTCSISAARGLAYRSLTNPGPAPLTLRMNAVLGGRFVGSGAQAAAGIYVLDTDAFQAAVEASGVSAAEFLLRGGDLLDFGTLRDGNLSLGRKVPGAIITSGFEVINFRVDEFGHEPLATGFFTLQPNQSVVIMFDLAVYASNGGQAAGIYGAAEFDHTLEPDANFFTDVNGNPVTGLILEGTPAPPVPPAASLVLGPSSATTPLGSTHSVTATVTTASGAPVTDAFVTFAIVSGPNAGSPGPIATDANGQAVFTYAGTTLGTDSIRASIGTLESNTVSNSWEVGPLDHIVITPSAATIAAGGAQDFTTQAFDAFNNSRGDVTAATTFSIGPDGSCANATCTATVAGAHTVTANHDGRLATAILTVLSQPDTCGIVVKPTTIKQGYLGQPYLQLLGATPSASYAFSVSNGALPPGLRLLTIAGVSTIIGIPTTPGSFTFTVTASSGSSCEGSRVYTMTLAPTVVPLLKCVVRNNNGSYTASFGYDNTTGAPVTIPIGSSNSFTPGNANRGQPTVFQAGLVNNAFNVTFKANGNNLAIWLLRGPDGVLRPVNITTALGCHQ